MSTISAQPAWIDTPSAFNLRRLVDHCRAPAQSFAVAVESALQQSKPWFIQAAIQLKMREDPFTEDEEGILLDKLADTDAFTELRLECFAGAELMVHFDAFQRFANKILVLVPTFEGVALDLNRTLDRNNRVAPFRIDFLRPPARPPPSMMLLRIASCWTDMVSLLLPVLQDCQTLALTRSQYYFEDDKDRAQFLGGDVLATLLSSTSTSHLLNISTPISFNDSTCLSESTKALQRPDCRLRTLCLKIDGNATDHLASFLAAIGPNTSLATLAIYLDTVRWSFMSLARVATMLAINDGLETLVLQAAASGSGEGVLSLLLALGSNRTLQTLNLSSLHFDNECAVFLAKLLQRPHCRSQLCRLVLTGTAVGHDGALALASAPHLEFADFYGTEINSETICSLVDKAPVLPNLGLSCDTISAKAAMAIGSTIGRHSILVHHLPADNKIRLMEATSPAQKGVVGSVPGCLLEASFASAERCVELFAQHAQLKHVWYINSDMTNFFQGEDKVRFEICQTLNRKVPTDLHQTIIDGGPLRPTEWCDVLGSVANEQLDCVYHLLAKWRLEGTSHHLVPSTKRNLAGGGAKTQAEGSKKPRLLGTTL